MNADQKLLAVEKRLQEAGVMDVKFYFHLGTKQLPTSVVKEATAKFLNSFLDNNYDVIDTVDETALA